MRVTEPRSQSTEECRTSTIIRPMNIESFYSLAFPGSIPSQDPSRAETELIREQDWVSLQR